MKELPKAYNPSEAEPKIYELWEKSGYFNPDNLPGERKEKFSMVLPPPNVTGTLHIGHAYEITLQDIIVRFERMRGKKTLWVPGTDHAAIATQAKVEKKIYDEEGKTRHDLGREEFLRRVTEFALQSQNTILNQLRKLGVSLDWSRLAFTLDEKRSIAVKTAFKRMYDAGLIYRGSRIVNWDPRLKTTVSDDEIEWKEVKEPFYYFKYGPFTIATARPETKFGDKYVVMHPEDKRYKEYKHGDKIEVEWINGRVTATIIKDEVIDMEFGTGVMTITPWHDATDFDIAQRHNLDAEQIIDLGGKLMPIAGEFAGLYFKKARPLIAEKLKIKGLLEKIDESYVHRVAINSRGGEPIEPQIMKQWFVNVDKKFTLRQSSGSSKIDGIPVDHPITLKEIMQKTVESGQIKIIPEQFEKRYFHWVENLRDWCISRQIWFGHQIPVWYCGDTLTKRMGFAGDIVQQVFDGKMSTWRLKDHGFQIGDEVAFEDSSTGKIFGYGKITKVEKTTVGGIDLKDKTHYKTYDNREELIAALKRHNPYKTVDLDSPVWSYTYEFDSKIKKGACGTQVVAVDAPDICPTCGEDSLTQDPDTLDPWFSSGLWTFSTLGWPSSVKTTEGKPEKTGDLATYHPTDLMNPGYEILFLWVSRMIFLSGFLLGEIPFKTAMMHGIVRDAQRRKFSKSSGIGGDPLEVVAIHGTDALRMALVSGVAMGNDPVFDMQQVKGYQHFGNKVWNIARFIQMNSSVTASDSEAVSEIASSQTPRNDNRKPEPKTEADKDILAKLDATIKSMTEDLENYRLHEAAQTIYHFTWHEFADVYIEASKKQMTDDNDGELKQNTLLILHSSLVIILKLLHPFMPFVTEEIYSRLTESQSRILDPDSKSRKSGQNLLMVAEWPK